MSFEAPPALLDTPVLALSGVSKSYGPHAAVRSAGLELRAGQITCLLGPSGCGKSTLLRLIAGLEPLDGGKILGGDGQVLSGHGVHVLPEKRRIGMVFQDYALFPHLKVWQNVAFGLKHLSKDEQRFRALKQLERVKMADRFDAYPQALSGGQQQRIALARALAPEPRAILLDEPFSGLDQALKIEVRAAILEALRASGAAVLVVTHDAEEALSMGDQVALMTRGEILQIGTPHDCYLRPVSPTAAQLLGETNDLPGVRDGQHVRTAYGLVECPTELRDHPGHFIVTARPEAFLIGEAGTPSQVIGTNYRGALIELTLQCQGVLTHAHAPAFVAPRVGDKVHVTLDPRLLQVFAA